MVKSIYSTHYSLLRKHPETSLTLKIQYHIKTLYSVGKITVPKTYNGEEIMESYFKRGCSLRDFITAITMADD